MVNLKKRSYDIEIMDDLNISGEVVPVTLKELNIINKLLGGNNVTIKGIQELVRSRPNSKNSTPLRIVDMGCGGGDILKIINDWAKEKNIQVELFGVDANEHITEYARKNSLGHDIEYITENVWTFPESREKFDIVIATLFLHHFTDEESSKLLSKWTDMSRLGVVINDIHRHPIAYYSIKWLTKYFSKSSMVKNDGPLSVQRAFWKSDFINILKMAGITNYKINWNWAFRWKLVISKVA